MNLPTWIKNKPAWLKGGLIALSIYALDILIVYLILVIGGSVLDKYPDVVAPGSGGFFIPFVVIAIYPGLFLVESYESMEIAIILNICFYFISGALIGIVATNKST